MLSLFKLAKSVVAFEFSFLSFFACLFQRINPSFCSDVTAANSLLCKGGLKRIHPRFPPNVTSCDFTSDLLDEETPADVHA